MPRLAALALLATCGGWTDARGWSPQGGRDQADRDLARAGWSATRDIHIGKALGEEHEEFGQIAGLAVDSTGRIYVLDSQKKRVQVFDPAGIYLRTIGREGQGPGEFQDPGGLGLSGRELVVVDFGAGRYSFFDLTGAFLRTSVRRVSGYHFPWKGRVDPDGGIIDYTVRSGAGVRRVALMRWDGAFRTEATIALPPFRETQVTAHGGQFRIGIPYSPQLVWTVGGNGRVWVADSPEYLVKAYSFSGGVADVIQLRHQRAKVSAADRRSAEESLTRAAARAGIAAARIASRIPEQRPAIAAIVVDETGLVWVQPILATGRSAADIFTHDGCYLGRLRLPVALHQPAVVTRDAIYVEEYHRSEAQRVVRVRLTRGASPCP